MAVKNIFLCALVISLALLLVASGCSSDTTYTPPEKIDSGPEPQEAAASPETTEPETPTQNEPEPQPEPEPPQIQIFEVGETATDNELEVTVNSVDFVELIDEQNNEFMVALAPAGKEYLIIDLTVENMLPETTQTISTMMSAEVVDQDGYTYDIDFEGEVALDQAFSDGDVLPGMKKRGQLAFLVPEDATDLKFIYKFDFFVGTSAVFDVK